MNQQELEERVNALEESNRTLVGAMRFVLLWMEYSTDLGKGKDSEDLAECREWRRELG